MTHQQRLQVEIYSHGGWWKANNGQTGQVPDALAAKGPMATVAALTNAFGVHGWRLTDLVSAHHNTYMLTFEATPAVQADEQSQTQRAEPESRRTVSISAG